MTTDDAIRASDGDREKVVTILRDAYVAGRLTLAEFDERTGTAFASRTWGELRKLTSDLPAGQVPGPRLPAPPAERDPVPAARPACGEPTASPGLARLIPALPIVFVWVVISLSAHSSAALVPIVVLLLMGLKFAGSRPHQDTHRPPRPPGRCRRPPC